MSGRQRARALIAEDEPLLAAVLDRELSRLWPELEIVGTVRDGSSAVTQALALRPDIVFLDIQMPGQNGIDAAEALCEDYPDDASLPLIVFVTAYDHYAVRAFEHSAIDYVLKPVQSERLAKTCTRLQAALRTRNDGAAAAAGQLESALSQLRGLIETRGAGAAPSALPAPPAPLRIIQASIGSTIHLVPVDDILFFEAEDKYIRVVTAARDYLIRQSLRQLLAQLDGQRFWQVHRGTIVNVDAIATAIRDDSGKVHLQLRGRARTVTVSRLYAQRFKPM
jgi:DNA-binding LytR/AlgR family response regulator